MNSSSNLTVYLGSVLSGALRTTVIVFYITVESLAIILNLLLIIAILRHRHTRRSINLLIANSAAGDLMIAIWNIPFQLATLSGSSWSVQGTSGRVVCKLIHFMGGMVLLVSPLNLLFITVERFRGVTSISMVELGRRGIYGLVVLAWVIPTALYSPLFYFIDLRDEMCEITVPWAYYRDYMMALFALFVVLYFTIVVLGVMILRRLQVIDVIVQLPEAQRIARKRRLGNAIKMVLCSLGSFILFTTPYHSLALHTIVSRSVTPLISKLIIAMLLFVCLNSALNPGICYVFIEDIRHAVKQVLSTGRVTQG
ncbi:predicted protein [Nematostella vectensis]|uniref:G-protein coupled receptors family 1 profile domain-containing protein n=1 Tax=Nematostella vectensis TaxID=45351 RepID=A7T2A3_NEMVE|nr:predicted protein [Nematostella vectensis]|eukprot:XP_001622009.1 predicted protein [Nematostella vectensis]